MSLSASVADAAAATNISRPATHSLRRILLYGGATLGLAVGAERGFGFLSSMLAARVAGPQTFGAYAVTLATAGTIAAYSAAGLGTTAQRFSGEYPSESAGYGGFLRAMIVITLASAAIAALFMLVAASPLARFVLHNESLTGLLRLAAISSAALIMLECCRGLLIGQRKFYSLLLVSVVSGMGLAIVLPLAAAVSATAMVGGQAAVALLAVLTCVAFSRRLGLRARHSDRTNDPGLRPIFMFGLIQFSAVAGITVASWYMASLVVRSDASLTQMGIYAVANQFRGLAAIGPGLFTLAGYSLLTDQSGSAYGGPSRVMLANTFLTTFVAAAIAILAIALAPWLLSLAYGSSYSSAEIPVVILLATAMVHMGGAPAAQRLSIVNLRATGIINFVWAVLLILLGIILVPGAGVAGAAIAFLLTHAISHWAVVAELMRAKELPRGYLTLSVATTLIATSLAALGYARSILAHYRGALTLAILSLGVLYLVSAMAIAARAGCAPAFFRTRFNRLSPVAETSP